MAVGFSKHASLSRLIAHYALGRYNSVMQVRVILVPYDSGHCRKRMGLGPDRIFEHGVSKLLSNMEIQFDTAEIVLDSPHPAEISAAFELGRKVAHKVWQSRTEGAFPLVLSGNCN